MKKIFTIILFFVFGLCQRPQAQWNLVWQDEFENNISSDWVFETGTGEWGWGNNEQQYYRRENISVVNGALQIQARKEDYGGMRYTSGRLKTQGRKSFKYGRIEARISMPSFNGVWPAFWMLGSNITSVGWPVCGEIDIMEHVNTGGEVHGTVHWDAYGHASYGGFTNTSVTDYHVYSIEWNDQNIKWFVDGTQYHEVNIANGVNSTEEFQNDFFIILNMAIGGEWPGYSIDEWAMPANMLVDYVRVYEKSDVTSSAPVQLYQHCGYTGYSVGLEAGSYTLSQLQSRGIQNDDISSLRVQNGYEVTMYQHHDFTGNAILKTSDDDCLVDDGFNDYISSLIIRSGNTASSIFLEAENYDSMAGVQTESCSEGGQNVGWIDAGDWMAFNNVSIQASGNYTVEYRVASPVGSSLSLDFNAGANRLGTVNIPASGGWQNWTTVKHSVYLEAGNYNFGIYAPSGGWNLNWWQITPGLKSAVKMTEADGAAKQPDAIEYVCSDNLLKIFGLSDYSIIEIFDIRGRSIYKRTSTGEALDIDISSFSKGIYILRVQSESDFKVFKFLK